MLALLFWALAALIVYHHGVYPLLARALAKRLRRSKAALPAPETLPAVSIVMPAYNEAAFIAGKIADLARLDYAGRVRVLIGVDGASDDTADCARDALMRLEGCAIDFEVFDFTVNRGKVAVLNELIARADGEIVVLTDISAAVPVDALTRLARHFADPAIGVVCGGYALSAPGSSGEDSYWRYQSAIKCDEAALGAPMGAHGAFYGFRRALFAPLPDDTINDDFILPMRIVAAGHRAVYDPDIAIVERERTRPAQEFRRRIRIGAGNFQQLLRLFALADPRRPGLAFSFLSGKGLRALMPLFLPLAFALNLWLAVAEGGYYPALALAQLLGYALALAGLSIPQERIGESRLNRALAALGYLVQGYAAGLIGILRLTPLFRHLGDDPQNLGQFADDGGYIHPMTRIGKRLLDIAIASVALAVFALLFIPIALAIRLDSRGPVFYRQLRVGRCTPRRTDLLYILKFRTMRVDAEKGTGAVWAKGRDPRITRVGNFLRKTRLDELPQCINVLKGEMSIVGPRPERPVFFPKLEAEIPFYAERTYSIKPGITGLAQVNHGYDESIEDVRTKVLFDHSYAMRIAKPLGWLKTDLSIIFKTVSVMALGKGQ